MSSFNSSRWVGEHTIGGSEVPLFGGSCEGSDLRPAHFVALHMMQTLPVAGYFADKFKLPGRTIVIALAVIKTLCAVFLFWQALQGQPFWPV